MNKFDNIPIFDSLTHPTIDGNWIMPRYSNASKIGDLLSSMQTHNICNSFAVGMKGIGNYKQEAYINFLKPYSEILLAISYFDVNEFSDLNVGLAELLNIKKLGFRGIKLHPRISNFSLRDPHLAIYIKEANRLGLIVLLCTYFYDKTRCACNNNLESLLDLLYNIDGSKIILLHSGSVRLLEMIEIARAYQNILLDLSLTLCKYEGSSLDFDIKFAFKSFDRRICIGTDHPEFTHEKLRERFAFFAEGISNEKLTNIASKNLTNFMNF